MAVPISNTTALLTGSNNNDGSLKDEFVSGLVQGGAWTFGGGPHELTYSLNINEKTGSFPGPDPEPGQGGTWTVRPDLAAAVASVFASWAAVANIHFEKIDSGRYYFESTANIAVTLTGNDLDNVFGAQVAGAGYFPDPGMVEAEVYSDRSGINRSTYPLPEGDVFLDNFEVLFEYSRPGGTGYTVILHEIGHALGLKHPHDDGGSGRPTFDALEISDHDKMRYTVMSYDIVQQAPAAHGFAATPMPLDILAIQQIYGANLSYHAGNDTYALLPGSFRTIWDAGGDDVLTAAAWSRTDGALIDLREGEFSGLLGGEARMAIAYDVTIENAVGSGGGDRLVGNSAANELDGAQGNDAVFGGSGADRLWGGKGSDRLQGQGGNDLLAYQHGDRLIDGGEGYDTLRFTGIRLDLGGAAGGRVTGIEQVELGGHADSRLTLDARAVLDLSPTSNILKVLGSAGDTVELEGDWVDHGQVGDFHHYRLGAAVLLVEDDVTVI